MQEYYAFTWPGKHQAIIEAGTPTSNTLRPCPDLSINFNTTQNLFIEGDNLEALKILQRSYMRKVKMIYIDPPYNTGNDFIYNDTFTQSEEDTRRQFGLFDDEGMRNFTMRHYRENVRTNPRFHSDWCSMIYPRLKAARTLLRDDGVIFISIDDNEMANLRKICDEIFGEDNFAAQLVWQKKYGPANDSKGISSTHEYVLVYASRLEAWRPGLTARTEEQLSAYHNPDNDPRGSWRASDLSARTYSPSCDYPITGPTGLVFTPPRGRSWTVSEQRYKELLDDGRITFGADGTGRPMRKTFLTEARQGITPETWTPRDRAGDNKEARYELKDIFPENLFATPKPTRLLRHLMTIADVKDDDIVMDFFAGSATTAHAVLALNHEDSGHRRFIMIQLPEPCPPNSEAYRAGYKTICDIGRERIIRASHGLDGDTGFRVFRLDTSNFRDVFINPEVLTQDTLDDLAENIKPGRSGLDLLFWCAAEYGLPLSCEYHCDEVGGLQVHRYNGDELVGCFDSGLNREVTEYIAKLKPARAVFRDSCFDDVNARINLEQIFRYYAPGSDIRVL